MARVVRFQDEDDMISNVAESFCSPSFAIESSEIDLLNELQQSSMMASTIHQRQYYGHTPHAKVIENQKLVKELKNLLVVDYKPYEPSSSTPCRGESIIMRHDEESSFHFDLKSDCEEVVKNRQSTPYATKLNLAQGDDEAEEYYSSPNDVSSFFNNSPSTPVVENSRVMQKTPITSDASKMNTSVASTPYYAAAESVLLAVSPETPARSSPPASTQPLPAVSSCGPSTHVVTSPDKSATLMKKEHHSEAKMTFTTTESSLPLSSMSSKTLTTQGGVAFGRGPTAKRSTMFPADYHTSTSTTTATVSTVVYQHPSMSSTAVTNAATVNTAMPPPVPVATTQPKVSNKDEGVQLHQPADWFSPQDTRKRPPAPIHSVKKADQRVAVHPVHPHLFDAPETQQHSQQGHAQQGLPPPCPRSNKISAATHTFLSASTTTSTSMNTDNAITNTIIPQTPPSKTLSVAVQTSTIKAETTATKATAATTAAMMFPSADQQDNSFEYSLQDLLPNYESSAEKLDISNLRSSSNNSQGTTTRSSTSLSWLKATGGTMVVSASSSRLGTCSRVLVPDQSIGDADACDVCADADDADAEEVEGEEDVHRHNIELPVSYNPTISSAMKALQQYQDFHSFQQEEEEEEEEEVAADLGMISMLPQGRLEDEEALIDNDDNDDMMDDVSRFLEETTFTLNQSMLTRYADDDEDEENEVASFDGQAAAGQQPKFIIRSLARSKEESMQNNLEVKEMTFETRPGELTTVMLNIANRQKKPISVLSKSILIRVEPLLQARLAGNQAPLLANGGDFSFDSTTAEETFSCSPERLEIAPKSEGMLFVTFAPQSNVEGIYSGMMRLKYHRKTCMVLLRGQSSYPVMDTTTLASMAAIPVSHDESSFFSSASACEAIAVHQQQQTQQQQPAPQSLLPPAPKTQQQYLAERLKSLKERVHNLSMNTTANQTMVTTATATLSRQYNHSFAYMGDVENSPAHVQNRLQPQQTEQQQAKQQEKEQPGKLEEAPASSKKDKKKRKEKNRNHQDQSEASFISHTGHTSHNASHASSSGSGLYFRKGRAEFGTVLCGSLVSTKIELCNATKKELTVYVSDVSLPFVMVHHEISLKPKSFVRIPARFVPTIPGEHQAEMIIQSSDGHYTASIGLHGIANQASP